MMGLACSSVVIAAGLALAGAVFGTAPAVAADCPGTGAETAKVAEVLSGDTLLLADGSVLRLAAVEAPMAPLGEDEAPAAAEASRAGLAALLGEGPLRLAWASEQPDRHGRRLARAALPDGRWLEAVLAGQGLVRVRWLPGQEDCFADLIPFEAAARMSATGLWADPAFAVLGADDPSLLSRNGLYAMVEGRVLSVGHGSRMIFLDFGPNVRHDFTVMVPPVVAEAMMAAGIDPDSYVGRRVRVRGVIEESGGPAIRLNDRLEIELVDVE